MNNLVLTNWLRDGKYRVRVLKLLETSPEIPKDIAKTLNIHKSSLSRILKNLHEKRLIEKITSSSRTITYKITSLGLRQLKDVLGKNGNK